MPENIAVVKPHYAKEEAFRMGFDRFKDLSGEETEGFDISHFKESATWANTVAPKLRAMSGFEDSMGVGTYQGNRKVAAIEPGCEEDSPAEAQLVEAHHIHSELVEAFDYGAYAAVEGRDKTEALADI